MTVTSGFSQYFEDACLNWFRGTTFPAVPAHLFVALFTTAPINGVDSAAVEVSGTSYVRKQITPNTSQFAAPSGAAPASMATNADVVFATPGGSWGTVVGWALYDASSAGNMICYGAFTGVAVGSGDTVEFLSGNLSVTVA
jgi:hypothetical protein